MTLWGLFLSSFVIGFSGAMMPGPLLGVTVDGSLKRGFIAGPLVVLGHGILELILIFLMVFGLNKFFSNPLVSGFIGLFGGAFLAWMGYGMIRSSINKSVSLHNQEAKSAAGKNLVLAGILVSLSNPYFILWWASTGMEFIRRSYTFGLFGLLLFFTGHILSDLFWYSGVSFAFARGRKVINDTLYRGIILLLGLFLLGFSIYFISSGWAMFTA